MRVLVTGAAGFVGGHVVDACLRRNWQVTALTRPESDAKKLKALGVGLISSPQLRSAMEEIDVVVHCAAKVGDWGPYEEYRQANVDYLRTLLDACKGQAVSRVIVISSLGVYPMRHHYQSDETMPIVANNRDAYSRSKVEAEKVALQYYRDFEVPIVLLRPGFVYGPGDNTVLPRIIQTLRKQGARYPGGGNAALNTIFVRNLVDAIFLAIQAEGAVGQTYNLTDGETVSKRRFMEKIADAMQLPHPWRRPPIWFAWSATWISETLAKLRGSKEAPAFNFTRLKFMGYNLDFSIEKAKRELGYRPRTAFEEAMNETLSWWKSQPAQPTS